MGSDYGEDFSGLELAKRLRNIKRYQFTPIIFITAMPTRELEAFRQIHCYDYIIKPFTEKEIEKVFQKILLDYVEYLSRKIVITTKNDIIEYIHMPLKKFKQKDELIATYKEAGKRKQIQQELKKLKAQYDGLEPKFPRYLCYLTGEYRKKYLHDMEIYCIHSYTQYFIHFIRYYRKDKIYVATYSF